MKSKILLGIVFFLSLTACNQQHKQESSSPFSPKIVEAKGYVVPHDSMAKPKTVLAGNPVAVKTGKPEVILTNTNVFPAGVPKVVKAGTPKIYKPGEDSIFVQKTVPAIDSPFMAGVPEMVLVKDAYIKDNNPKNFSSFTKLQGLKHNNIFCIMQDNIGNLWFGTVGGACRYDGKYFTHFTTKEGLSNDFVTSILQDKRGNMWFGTWGGGVNRFNGKKFTHFTQKEGLGYNVVLSILQDKQGNMWFGAMNGYISKYDGKTFTNFSIKDDNIKNTIESIIQDKRGNLWFGTFSNGVFCYDGKSVKHFTPKEGLTNISVPSMLEDKNGKIWFSISRNGVCCYDGKTFLQYNGKEGLGNKTVSEIIQDKSGDLWFGTHEDGLFRYDGKSYEHFTEKEGLSNNTVYCLFMDKNGTIWTGGAGGGVNRYNGNIFTHYTEKEGLSDKRVESIKQDKGGNLWFGTWAGGANRYDGKSFTRFTKKQGLSNQLMTCILQDKSGNLWFSTWGDGVFYYDGKCFLHYTEKEGLSFNYVQSIIQDKSGNIWFGTDSGGECCFDGKYFTTYAEKQGLSSSSFHSSLQDKNGNLWFGTDQGVNRYDGKSFTHFTEKEGLSNNYITGILQDNNGSFWFGTRGGGVCRYDGKSFMCFTEKEGLCSNDVESALQDKSGNLWFGTAAGLSKLSADYMVKLAKVTDKGSTDQPVLFKNYTYEDGFLGIGCNGNSISKDDNGIIWIGTNDRLTAYHPEGDEADTSGPNIQMTGIQLFNENISWLKFDENKDTSLVLGNGVSVSKVKFDSISSWYFLPQNLSLAYNNNYLTFHFIGITQKQSQKVKYKYKLEGLDNNWSGMTSRTEVPYGNIPNGTYTFKVKAMNSEGYWSKEYRYTFIIRPPWWKTWWARTGSGLIVLMLALVFYYRRIASFRQRQKELEKEVEVATVEIRKQKEEAESQRAKAEKSEKFKQQFLANMSHEIRTPMNAVMGMTDLVLGTSLEEKQKFYLVRIKKSSDNLLHIINDILDLSKIEAGKMELEHIDFSINDLVDQVKQTLQHRAEEKGLAFITHVKSDVSDVVMGDPARLNQVLINLAGNAIKFTEKGSVTIEVTKENQGIRFAIVDTGIGIPKDKLQTVFENFSQANASDTRKHGGTGLGLSISQQLVGMMGGNIEVESKEGSGTTFSFIAKLENGSVDRLEQLQGLEQNVDGSILNGLKILITDDNEDNRIVARDTLISKANVEIYEASNGQETIDLVKDIQFDVILMDVQMPVMNGFDATRFIRANFDSPAKDTPIIGLTASVLRTDLDKCREAGMDSYIPKPFNAQQLITGIAQVLNIALKVNKETHPVSQGKQQSRVTDMAYLEQFCLSDRKKMQKYINMFLDSAQPFIEKITGALTQDDYQEIAIQVHGYKTKFMMMGMNNAKILSDIIEIQCHEGINPDDARENVLNLIRQIETAIIELQTIG